MDWLFDINLWASLLTLTGLEIVLGIDNLVFIAILVGQVDLAHRKTVRITGISLAMIMRISMLLSVTWLMSFTNPLFSAFSIDFSFKDVLMLAGGLFLIAKSTKELHEMIRPATEENGEPRIKAKTSMFGAIMQVVLIDFIFSFDSIITAVAMTSHTGVIIAAIVISMIVMLVASNAVSIFINTHPSIKVLALAFVLMIGAMLMADGFHYHVERGYIYSAMLFSLLVETINLVSDSRGRKKAD